MTAVLEREGVQQLPVEELVLNSCGSVSCCCNLLESSCSRQVPVMIVVGRMPPGWIPSSVDATCPEPLDSKYSLEALALHCGVPVLVVPKRHPRRVLLADDPDRLPRREGQNPGAAVVPSWNPWLCCTPHKPNAMVR